MPLIKSRYTTRSAVAYDPVDPAATPDNSFETVSQTLETLKAQLRVLQSRLIVPMDESLSPEDWFDYQVLHQALISVSRELADAHRVLAGMRSRPTSGKRPERVLYRQEASGQFSRLSPEDSKAVREDPEAAIGFGYFPLFKCTDWIVRGGEAAGQPPGSTLVQAEFVMNDALRERYLANLVQFGQVEPARVRMLNANLQMEIALDVANKCALSGVEVPREWREFAVAVEKVMADPSATLPSQPVLPDGVVGLKKPVVLPV